MNFFVSIIVVSIYLFIGTSIGKSDFENQYYYFESDVSKFPVSNDQSPSKDNLKNEIDNNIELGSKSLTDYVDDKRNNSLNLTANFKNYVSRVCQNINTTNLLMTVKLPNTTAQKLSTTVQLSNGRLMDVKSISPYKDCPGSYGVDTYTLETRMLVQEFKVFYDCELTVFWVLTTNFRVAAVVNNMKVDSKFLFNSTNFEVKLDYINIPQGTKIKVDIDREGAPVLSYIFNQFLSFVFYFTETSILDNAQNSARDFIQKKLAALPKLNNTTPDLPQLKCFGFWLINH